MRVWAFYHSYKSDHVMFCHVKIKNPKQSIGAKEF